MLRTRRATVALLVLAVLAGPRLARAQEATTQSASLTPAEIEALYKARTDSARMRFTPADVAFVTGMIGHHAQAILMSELAPTHGASPQVQTLAARIINAQRDEIALMQRWLSDRGQPVPQVRIQGLHLAIETPGDGGMAADDHAGHRATGQHEMRNTAEAHGDHAMMPGMLTQEQLEQLDRARGEEFDRLFLQGMIHHHGGAVTMVDELVITDGAAQDGAVFKLASDIQVDQVTEIARMRRMLNEMENDR